MRSLARYTVELQRPYGGWQDLHEATGLARRAADEMRDEGTPVRFLRSVYVPEDDACFLLYEGPSARSVKNAAIRAQLGVRHVGKALQLDPQPGGEVKGEEA